MGWFSYPDGMDHEETQSLTPIASDSPWLERCGTLLRPQSDPALFGSADANLYFAADGQPGAGQGCAGHTSRGFRGAELFGRIA